MQQTTIQDILNACLGKVYPANPVEYFDKMYAPINPGMMFEAIEDAKILVKSENERKSSKKQIETANVFVTLGGETLNQSFYTGVIATLLWLPKYILEVSDRLKLSQIEVDNCLKILKEAKIPQIHDVREEVINDNKITIIPSNVRHYSAFLASIVSWLNTGVTDFKVKGPMRTNGELSKYLSSLALESFPSVPFGCYYVGSCQTSDIYGLSEKLGKSFDWTKYMTEECYMLNEPKFVVTTDNAPVVSIAGHPLTDTFVAEIKDGDAKWIGLFIETEEFSSLCAKEGLNTTMIKKYIIDNTLVDHKDKLEKKDPIALFLEKNKIVKQCFELRHKFSCMQQMNETEEYDV
jgi:hypothetical protein